MGLANVYLPGQYLITLASNLVQKFVVIVLILSGGINTTFKALYPKPLQCTNMRVMGAVQMTYKESSRPWPRSLGAPQAVPPPHWPTSIHRSAFSLNTLLIALFLTMRS